MLFRSQNHRVSSRTFRGILAFVLSVCVALSAVMPAGAQDAGAAPVLQGEIAYVLDGDIWLHDLLTGKARQLTTDGDNMAPRWSPNGKYLVYAHGPDLESSDLHVLDVAGGGKPKLLVEQACCGAWSPDGIRVAYVALGGDELALKSVAADGSGEETLFSPLAFGRGVYAAGAVDWVDQNYLVVPLEVIGEDSLVIYRDVFTIDLPIRMMDSGLRQDDCAVLSRDVVTIPGDTGGGLLAEAIAFENAGATCTAVMQPVTAPKGVDLVRYGSGKGRELPWLAAPSLSADALFLAAERYAENNVPADAELEGVVAVNLRDMSEQSVAVDASQPAWRPAPALDPAAVAYVQPGEHLVTLEPPLIDGGKSYRVSYMTTGDMTRRDAGFLHAATPEFLKSQQITGLVVTADGKRVTDPAEIRRILGLYHAAYHLYSQPVPDLIPLLGDELDKVLANPLFMGMEPAKFLTSPRNQTAEALRAMLTVSNGGRLTAVLDQALAGTSNNVGDALSALGKIIEDQHTANAALAAMKVDLEAAYKASSETAQWGERDIKLLRLMADLAFLRALQSERAGWLQAYVDTFPSGEGSLSRDQIRAAATVLAEVASADKQRVNLIVDFVQEETTGALVNAGGKLTQKAAADLVAQLAAKYGASVSSQAVASLLSTVSVGLTVNGILYGSDELVANFMLARRAEELRTAFRAAIQDAQTQAGAPARPDQQPASYDGAQAAAYRTAVLMDTLAGVTAQRAYAGGVTATLQMPNPLELLNWLQGKDWESAADGLRKLANNAESQVLDDLAGQSALDAAVALAAGRGAPKAGGGETFVDPATDIPYVRVPAGEFLMGSSEEQVDAAIKLCEETYGVGSCDRGWFESDMPQHTVTLDEYWIGRTEVTNAQYAACVTVGACEPPYKESSPTRDSYYGSAEYAEYPVINVDWYQADAFCKWAGGRLPTEAEWEKAARGTDGRIYPWGDSTPDETLLNFNGNVGDTTAVGSYPTGASPYGAMDMAGNVWEWVSDWYQGDYYSVSPAQNPTGPESGEYRVLRGGSWDSNSDSVRAANRGSRYPDYWYGVIGFRCVRSQ